MTTPHPNPSEWIELVDGQLPVVRAQALREHAHDCNACQAQLEGIEELVGRIRAPWLEAPSPDAVAKVMVRVRTQPSRPTLGRARRARWASIAGGVGLAAALLFFARSPAPRDEAGMQPRGGGAKLARADRTRVSVQVGKRILSAGARVGANAAFSVTYWSVETATTYLMVFLVDSEGEAHWIYPAYTRAEERPVSTVLAPSAGERALPDTVTLESPAHGAAHLFTVLSSHPLEVASVEGLPRERRSLPSLRALWPAAAVTELPIDIAADEKKP